MGIIFSDMCALREGDIYKTLNVEVKVPLAAAETDNDVTAMAKELARAELKKEAAAIASSPELEVILANVDIRRRSDTDGIAIYSATAEAYVHNTKPTARAVKKD